MERYEDRIIKNSENLDTVRLPFQSIPIIDIGPFIQQDQSRIGQTLQEIDQACRDVGFFYIRNHGISETLIQAAFEQTEQFFALPNEEKLELDINKLDYYRGYVALGDTGEPGQYHDTQESLEICLELPDDDPDYLAGNFLYGPNLWPKHLPEFRDVIYTYFEESLRLGQILFRAFALTLGMEEDFFEDKLTKPITQMRLIYYPPQEGIPIAGRLGSNPHLDFDTFTTLAMSRDGLQVQNPVGDWIEAPCIPGTLVVNLGEMMTRWTNGKYIATPHRVLSPTQGSRYSIPIFFGLNYDAIVNVLPTCQGPDNPPRYKPVKNGEWTEQCIRSVYYVKNAKE